MRLSSNMIFASPSRRTEFINTRAPPDAPVVRAGMPSLVVPREKSAEGTPEITSRVDTIYACDATVERRCDCHDIGRHHMRQRAQRRISTYMPPSRAPLEIFAMRSASCRHAFPILRVARRPQAAML